MTAHYLEEKTAIAQQLGYNSYLSAVVSLYNEKEMSLRKVGEIFNSTYQAILYQLKKNGIKRRARGGVNNIRGNLNK